MPKLNRLWEKMPKFLGFDGQVVEQVTTMQDGQKGRPARPQRVKGRGVPQGTLRI